MFGQNKKMNQLKEDIQALKIRLDSYEWAFNKTPKFKVGGLVGFYNNGWILVVTITDIFPYFRTKTNKHTFMYKVTLLYPSHYYRFDIVPESMIVNLTEEQINEHTPQLNKLNKDYELNKQ